MVLVGNKLDLESERKVTTRNGEMKAKSYGVACACNNLIINQDVIYSWKLALKRAKTLLSYLLMLLNSS